MITIVGTCHVFDLKDRVKALIVRSRPQAVCIELDRKRFERLRGQKGPPLGWRSLLFIVQQALARHYGTYAGNDMLGGIEGAESIQSPVFLIDRDIDWIMDNLKVAIVQEFIYPLSVWRKLPTFINLAKRDLVYISRFPDWLEALVDDFEKDQERYRQEFEQLFPLLKRIIMDEREKYMAIEIGKLAQVYRDIVVIVGAAHLVGLTRLLSDLSIRCVNIRELRATPGLNSA
jgi:pheromone shutdown protein TraB